MSRLLAVLSVVLLLTVQPVLCFYGIAVPVSPSSGPDPIPNADCLFVYSCVSHAVPLSSLNATGLLVVLDPDISAEAVFVGRAALRCQRRLQELKCKISDAVIQENECRASGWPDDNVASE